jgi:hypothetical protein
MATEIRERTYHVRNTEKCFRFKPEAFENHAPENKGIYELVTFDSAQNPKILFIGAAFEKGIKQSLEEHAAGTMAPIAAEIMREHPNLYFDYLTEMDARTKEDAQDIYWWLVQKNNPPFNDAEKTKHSGRYDTISVVEL